MAQTELKIGEVATRAGVSVDALRYYERMKLLPRARRTSGGFRLFGSESVERVQFIRQAKESGLSLEEIRGLLTTGGAAECKRVRDLLAAKLEELDTRIQAMKQFRRTLRQHLTACERELMDSRRLSLLSCGRHQTSEKLKSDAMTCKRKRI